MSLEVSERWWADVSQRGWLWFQEPFRSERFFFFSACVGLSCSVLVCTFMLWFKEERTPYGRYHNHRTCGMEWGVQIPAKWAWILQEIPCVIAAAVCVTVADPLVWECDSNRVVFSLFTLHYLFRAFIYPFLRGGNPSPLRIVLSASVFCSTNGYAQTRYLTALANSHDCRSCGSASFVLGVGLWAAGLTMNLHADNILRNLRAPGETGYKIPHGGMFRYVSGANFLGEVVEWTGYAIAMGGALPGVMFAFVTLLNIGARAVHHHDWYMKKFDSYHTLGRKALIPYIF